MPDTEPPLPTDVAIYEARNRLAAIIERARFERASTYLLNRGKRVVAVVPLALAEAADEVGGPTAALEILRAHIDAHA